MIAIVLMNDRIVPVNDAVLLAAVTIIQVEGIGPVGIGTQDGFTGTEIAGGEKVGFYGNNGIGGADSRTGVGAGIADVDRGPVFPTGGNGRGVVKRGVVDHRPVEKGIAVKTHEGGTRMLPHPRRSPHFAAQPEIGGQIPVDVQVTVYQHVISPDHQGVHSGDQHA